MLSLSEIATELEAEAKRLRAGWGNVAALTRLADRLDRLSNDVWQQPPAQAGHNHEELS